MFASEILTALLRFLVFWDNLSSQTEVPKLSFQCHVSFLTFDCPGINEKGFPNAWTPFVFTHAIIATNPLNASG